MGRSMNKSSSGALAGVIALAVVGGGAVRIAAQEQQQQQQQEQEEQAPSVEAAPIVIGECEGPAGLGGFTFAVEPKPLSAEVERGLDWIVAHQLADGGFGQGEESVDMGTGMEGFVAQSDVADTCIAALALSRSGAAPGNGPRGLALARAVAYVCGQVEAADQESLFVTNVRGTRVQMKIGTYVDTFFASMLLSQVKGRMGEGQADARVEAALAKVLAKIAKNQREDGGFEGNGWAPVLSQSMASKGINWAYQAGASVDPAVAAENSAYFLGSSETAGGLVAGGPGTVSAVDAGAAGIPLYSLASKLGGLRDFVNSGERRQRELEVVLATEKDEAKLDAAKNEQAQIAKAKDAQREVQIAVVGRLEDPSFVAGFGSNGGEEFLSYMNIGESLVVEGGEGWKSWDVSMTANLKRVQNEDGSWTGHHCITGRTFVTSTALLTLMADRTLVPVEVLSEETAVETAPVEVAGERE